MKKLILLLPFIAMSCSNKEAEAELANVRDSLNKIEADNKLKALRDSISTVNAEANQEKKETEFMAKRAQEVADSIANAISASMNAH